MTIGFKNPENNLFEILTPSKKGNLKKFLHSGKILLGLSNSSFFQHNNRIPIFNFSLVHLGKLSL